MHPPNVLIATLHYYPEISAGVHQPAFTEDYLVRRGFRVTMLAPMGPKRGVHGARMLRVDLPHYLDANKEASTGSWRQWIPRPVRRFIRRWLLVPDVFLTWSVQAAHQAIRFGADDPYHLVITVSPPESIHWIGWQAKRRLGSVWVADFRDGWTFEPHRKEVLLPGRRWLDRRLERAVVERADWVLTNTHAVANDFRQRYPHRRERIHAMPTGFARSDFAPAGQEPGRFRLVFTGRFGLSWQEASPRPFLDGLVQALKADRDFAHRFRLVLVGDFTHEEECLWSAPPLNTVVEQIPPRPYEQAMRLAAGATMLLLIAPRGLRSVVPRKLFDYLAVRRPIFAVADPCELTRILQETRAGVWQSPEDTARIASELLRLFGLWKSGRLDEEIPCSGNERYRSEPLFDRVLGQLVLKPWEGLCLTNP